MNLRHVCHRLTSSLRRVVCCRRRHLVSELCHRSCGSARTMMEQYFHIRTLPMYTLANSCKAIILIMSVALAFFTYVTFFSIIHSKLSKVNDDSRSPQDLPWKKDVPWIVKRNTLPNFFMRKRVTDGHKWPPNDYYRSGVIVFVHNTKAGGAAMRQCLNHLRRPWNKTTPISLYSAISDELKSSYSELLNSSQMLHNNDMYWGDMAIGVCDYISKPCSYFTMFRNPYDRVVASYLMCRGREHKPHICKFKRADEMTIKEWALYQGSLTFDQLLLNPEFLANKSKYSQLLYGSLNATHHESNFAWLENRNLLNQLVSESQRQEILQYILVNLKSWFSVIGLTEKYDLSFQFFEHVYQLPFYAKCAQPHEVFQSDVVQTRKMVEQLRMDPDVRTALYYDLEIYRVAREIFHFQVEGYNLERSYG
ncbi:uncharacterized protein [Ptychodera flava]|uniref:uncharacterized protein isoform X1 n=1 Tax=Ptychodera flava TaxID=63121 RepID=UPI003969D0CC